jgi:hypothetical protein
VTKRVAKEVRVSSGKPGQRQEQRRPVPAPPPATGSAAACARCAGRAPGAPRRCADPPRARLARPPRRPASPPTPPAAPPPAPPPGRGEGQRVLGRSGRDKLRRQPGRASTLGPARPSVYARTCPSSFPTHLGDAAVPRTSLHLCQGAELAAASSTYGQLDRRPVAPTGRFSACSWTHGHACSGKVG